MAPRPSGPVWLTLAVCAASVAVALLLLPGLAGWPVAGAVAALIAVGGAFWLQSDAKRDTPGELGRLLMFGLAAALPSLLISHAIEDRQKKLESEFASRQRADDLRLQIGFQRSLAGADLRGRDLSGFELPGRNLKEAELQGARFAGANLRKADLSGAKLDGAILTGADLTQANLAGATLAGARLDRARLFSTDLTGACFGSRRSAEKSFAPADLRGARLAGAFLEGANFAGADLRGTHFTEDLRNARHVRGAVFVGARVLGATWPRGFRVRTAAEGGLPAVPLEATPPEAVADTVVQATDGDTVLLEDFGAAEVLGVDAPRADDPGGGRRAQRYARTRLAPGTRVRYLPSVGSEGRPQDTFGRSFVYLWRAGPPDGDAPRGWLFNREMVARGYAKVARRFLEEQVPRSEIDGELRQEIVDSQEPAKRGAYGVWSACYDS